MTLFLVGRSLSMTRSEWNDWRIMAESLWVDTKDKKKNSHYKNRIVIILIIIII